ncbi:hypothetical protein ACWE42_19745 [Sutcliffiella cohnii]|nr:MULTISPECIES: hypothetical protein [Sutcliffiella]MED4016900.1 hypothetical protein [Sutcliffiella cohnii]WBL16264.1 hypothetical protein O1A01_06440 [Sutcliffiella sp. NC1]
MSNQTGAFKQNKSNIHLLSIRLSSSFEKNKHIILASPLYLILMGQEGEISWT